MGYRVRDYLSSLGKEGWELVSVAPQIGDLNPMKGKSAAVASLMDFAIAGPRVTTISQHRAGTVGYFFWFKRPMEIINCPVCKAELINAKFFLYKMRKQINS